MNWDLRQWGTRGQWVGRPLRHCSNRNEAIAGALFNVGSKQSPTGRWEVGCGRKVTGCEKRLTLGPSPRYSS